MENKTNGFALFIDIDDVLINSSDYIQKQVNAETIFKTKALGAIEQLIRNCKFYAMKMREEHGEDSLEFTSAKYYLEIAKSINDEFLEERDMFLENDNMPRGEHKTYNYEEESKRLSAFKKIIADNYETLNKICTYCYKMAIKISTEARRNGEKPDYQGLIAMDSNDIVRTNKESDNYEETMYVQPIIAVDSCLHGECGNLFDYVLNNFGTKDNFCIKEKCSEEIVDYGYIYSIYHADREAAFYLQKAIHELGIEKVYIISHHNGDREFNAKKNLMEKLFPGVSVIGLRFHNTEHNLGRRNRSPKFDAADSYLQEQGIEMPHELMILLDDSIANCQNWVQNNGTAVLYRRETDAEKVTGRTSYNDYERLIDFQEVSEILSRTMQNVRENRGKRLIKND